MLGQRYRFHGHGSLRFLYARGAAVRSSLLTIKYSNNPRRRSSRFAVVISKKILKSAVGRNRVRRRVYEIIRHQLPLLKTNQDVAVLVFSAEVLQKSHQDLQAIISQLFAQAGLYK